MKTAKERLEELIEDIDGSIAALGGAEESEGMIMGAMISVSILTHSKATALAALVQLEHAPAGVDPLGYDEEFEKDIKAMQDRMNKRRGFRRGKDSSDL